MAMISSRSPNTAGDGLLDELELGDVLALIEAEGERLADGLKEGELDALGLVEALGLAEAETELLGERLALGLID